ncbi:MAG TPA: hypothetical protein V6C58_25575 [Allocoleopsis sp.]
MKKLQILKNTKELDYTHLAGIAVKDKGYVGVNIELLWKYTRNENKFLSLFSEYYTHEWLHLYLKNIGTPFGEEVVIRKLLNQRFSKAEKDYYKQLFK